MELAFLDLALPLRSHAQPHFGTYLLGWLFVSMCRTGESAPLVPHRPAAPSGTDPGTGEGRLPSPRTRALASASAASPAPTTLSDILTEDREVSSGESHRPCCHSIFAVPGPGSCLRAPYFCIRGVTGAQVYFPPCCRLLSFWWCRYAAPHRTDSIQDTLWQAWGSNWCVLPHPACVSLWCMVSCALHDDGTHMLLLLPWNSRRGQRCHHCYDKPPRPNAQRGLGQRGTHAPWWAGPTRSCVRAHNSSQAHVWQANTCSANGWYVLRTLPCSMLQWSLCLLR